MFRPSTLFGLAIFFGLCLAQFVPDAVLAQAGTASDSPLASVAQVRTPYPAPEDSTVELTLLTDGVDSGGNWVQTFQMLVKPGGTLAEASELIYGTSTHVDELFAAIRRQHPEITNPAAVPANLTADLALDPRIAFVPQRVTIDPRAGATISDYYNGARRIVYDAGKAGDHKGLSEIVDLPADRPAKSFQVLEDATLLEVAAGVRVAHYEFQLEDNLKSVISQIYDTPSTKAIGDFLGQTRWDPNRWPPAPLDRQQRLVIPLGVSFADDPFTPLDLAANSSNEKLVGQVSERAKAGIFAVRRQPYGTVYHVVANDFNLTARQAAKMLYGDEEQYLTIVASAGLGSLYDLERDPPKDVRLFGKVFDLAVEYEQERFTDRELVDAQTARKSTILLNGTVVEEYDNPAGKSGLLRQVLLPSGYRKILFRPQSLTLMGGQILHTLASLGRTSNPQVHQEEEANFVARLMWEWGRSIPHGPGESLDYGRLISVPGDETAQPDQLIEFAIRPASADFAPASPLYRGLMTSPFFIGIAVVFVAFLGLGMFSMLARHV